MKPLYHYFREWVQIKWLCVYVCQVVLFMGRGCIHIFYLSKSSNALSYQCKKKVKEAWLGNCIGELYKVAAFQSIAGLLSYIC